LTAWNIFKKFKYYFTAKPIFSTGKKKATIPKILIFSTGKRKKKLYHL